MMTNSLTPEEVLDRHLKQSRSENAEEFLQSYRDNSFLITSAGVYRGLQEIRACHQHLKDVLPNARYDYKVRLVEKNIGFLEWSADSGAHRVTDGADSYVIQDGYILAQTIHYTLIPKQR